MPICNTFFVSMSNFDRRTFIKVAGGAGTIGLAGCTRDTGGEDGDTTTTTESDGGGDGGDGEDTTTTTEQQSLDIGMVYALGGLGDKSFNDMAHTGVKQAKDELGISFENGQPSKQSEFSTFQRRFAQSSDPDYNLICCIGFLQQSALAETAPNFPDQKFMLVDSVVEEDNVANYVFKEHEGSFQVGHLAGLLTTEDFSAGAGSTASGSTTLGFVGGVEAPLIKKFQAGFEAGAKYANESINVNVAYTGSFSDPAAGKEAALSMYDDGADIVYHAAGGTGTGVFQAAQERGKFAVGVDADQSKSESKFADVILASMVKRVDTAVYNAIQSVVEDSFNGETNTLGLEQDGVACVYGAELGSEISSDVKGAIDDSREKIINGEISVPQDPENV